MFKELLRLFCSLDRRGLLLLIGALALASNLVAYFGMQLLMGLEPCPLCILDRVALFIVIGAVAIYLLPFALARAAGLVLLFSGLALGLASTIRHVWLEYNPESASCLFPSQEGGALSYVLDAFAGTTDCTEVAYRLLGFSLSEMTLALFVILLGLLLFALTRRA